MLHLPALCYFDTSVTYPQSFRRVKFVVIPPRFIQPAVSCYNSWANCGVRAAHRQGKNLCEMGLLPEGDFIRDTPVMNYWNKLAFYVSKMSNFPWLTPSELMYFYVQNGRGTMITFSTVSPDCDGAGSRNPSSRRTDIRLLYTTVTT